MTASRQLRLGFAEAWRDASDFEAVESYYRVMHGPREYVPPPEPDCEDGAAWERFNSSLEAFETELAAVVDGWTCRRCRYWQSTEGEGGRCGALEAETAGDDCCEGWTPFLIKR